MYWYTYASYLEFSVISYIMGLYPLHPLLQFKPILALQKIVRFLNVSKVLEIYGKIMFQSILFFHNFPTSRNIWKYKVY